MEWNGMDKMRPRTPILTKHSNPRCFLNYTAKMGELLWCRLPSLHPTSVRGWFLFHTLFTQSLLKLCPKEPYGLRLTAPLLARGYTCSIQLTFLQILKLVETKYMVVWCCTFDYIFCLSGSLAKTEFKLFCLVFATLAFCPRHSHGPEVVYIYIYLFVFLSSFPFSLPDVSKLNKIVLFLNTKVSVACSYSRPYVQYCFTLQAKQNSFTLSVLILVSEKG